MPPLSGVALRWQFPLQLWRTATLKQQSLPNKQTGLHMDSETAVQEQRANLILSRLPDFGPARYWQLRRRFPSSRAVLDAAVSSLGDILDQPACDQLTAYQRSPHDHPLGQRAERDLEWLAENDVVLLTPDDPYYPSLLKTIHQVPPMLFVRGNLDNLILPQLAIVGSRNPSPSGKTNAFEFARQLSRTGFAVTSGLALGVDGAAHGGALAAGGKTIAVMGTGMDIIYPSRHRGLATRLLAEGGTLVSEFPLGAAPQPDHFPRRNRIISGMSLGVLVVEAAIKSGSLITARYAMQQGREVFAIPGSIHNPMSRGCHALLRDGATLVEQVNDLKEPLQGLLALKWAETEPDSDPTPRLSPSLSGEERLVFDNIGFENISLDTLLERTGLAAGPTLALLMGLELKGLIQQTPGGYQREGDSVAIHSS